MNRSHAFSNAPRRSLIALLCAAAAGGVFAQVDSSRTRIQATETQPAVERGPGVPGADTGVPPAPVGPGRPIKVGCCRCLGETLQPINISTGQPASQPVPWTVNGGPSFITSTTLGWANSPGAQWIAPSASGGNGQPAVHTYELKIEVPRCVIPGNVTISGKFWADNMGTVSLSGLGAPTNQYTTLGGIYGFTQPNAGNFSYTVPGPGVYTLKVVGRNEGSVTGMLMNATVTKRCATEPIGPAVPGNPASSPI